MLVRLTKTDMTKRKPFSACISILLLCSLPLTRYILSAANRVLRFHLNIFVIDI